MDKKEMAIRLLNIIAFNDMLDREVKKQTDGEPSFCDMEDYKQSKSILQKACLGILSDKEKNKNDNT